MTFSKEEKARLLEDWKKSGKSISAFARENGLARWTFTKWLKAERGTEPCFAEVPNGAIKATTQAPEILIEKGAMKIHIPLAIGDCALRVVIESLEAAS